MVVNRRTEEPQDGMSRRTCSHGVRIACPRHTRLTIIGGECQENIAGAPRAVETA
jgi:hypothetical protein